MTHELITDTNGKLTIIFDLRVDILHVYLEGCIIYSCLLKEGKHGNVDMRKNLIFIENFCLPTKLFTHEQIEYLKRFI